MKKTRILIAVAVAVLAVGALSLFPSTQADPCEVDGQCLRDCEAEFITCRDACPTGDLPCVSACASQLSACAAGCTTCE